MSFGRGKRFVSPVSETPGPGHYGVGKVGRPQAAVFFKSRRFSSPPHPAQAVPIATPLQQRATPSLARTTSDDSCIRPARKQRPHRLNFAPGAETLQETYEQLRLELSRQQQMKEEERRDLAAVVAGEWPSPGSSLLDKAAWDRAVLWRDSTLQLQCQIGALNEIIGEEISRNAELKANEKALKTEKAVHEALALERGAALTAAHTSASMEKAEHEAALAEKEEECASALMAKTEYMDLLGKQENEHEAILKQVNKTFEANLEASLAAVAEVHDARTAELKTDSQARLAKKQEELEAALAAANVGFETRAAAVAIEAERMREEHRALGSVVAAQEAKIGELTEKVEMQETQLKEGDRALEASVEENRAQQIVMRDLQATMVAATADGKRTQSRLQGVVAELDAMTHRAGDMERAQADGEVMLAQLTAAHAAVESDLRASIAALQVAQQHGKETIMDKQVALETALAATSDAQAMVAELTEQVRVEKETGVRALKVANSVIAAMKEDVRACKETIRVGESKLDVVTALIDAERMHVQNAADREIEEMQVQRDSLQVTIGELETAMRQQSVENELSLEDAREMVFAAEARVVALNATLAETSADAAMKFASAQQQIEELQAECVAAQDTAVVANASVVELSARCTSQERMAQEGAEVHRAALDRAGEDVAQARAELVQAQSRHTDLAAIHNVLTATHSQLVKANAHLQVEQIALQGAHQSLESAHAVVKKERADLRREHLALEQSHAQLQSSSIAKEDGLQAVIESMTTKLATLTAETEETAASIVVQQCYVGGILAEKADLTQKLVSFAEENCELQHDKAVVLEHASIAMRMCASLQKLAEQLRCDWLDLLAHSESLETFSGFDRSSFDVKYSIRSFLWDDEGANNVVSLPVGIPKWVESRLANTQFRLALTEKEANELQQRAAFSERGLAALVGQRNLSQRIQLHDKMRKENESLWSENRDLKRRLAKLKSSGMSRAMLLTTRSSSENRDPRHMSRIELDEATLGGKRRRAM